MDTWDFLNQVYEPMFRRVQGLGRQLAAAGYTATWSWYNLHACRRGDEYKVEMFPIPVITVGNWCDVILELDSICVDAHLDNAQGRAFRWGRVPWAFEIYGIEDYTEDLYTPGMPRGELPERIAKYGGEIGVAFSMPWESGDDEIMNIVNACREWGTHIRKAAEGVPPQE